MGTEKDTVAVCFTINYAFLEGSAQLQRLSSVALFVTHYPFFYPTYHRF